MKAKILFLLLFLTPMSWAADNIVNVFNWAGYLPQSVINKFEKATGIYVNYSEFDSNETLYAKLKSSHNAGYDVIVPSNYLIGRMKKQDMLHKLDKAQLPNFKFLNPNLLNRDFDPNNQYSIPYLWGTTGIVINTKYIKPESVHDWSDLWKYEYKNQLLMFDDLRDIYAIAMITLNYSVNDTNPKHIQEAYLKLKSLWPNIKLFNSDAEKSMYIDEDVIIGMGYNGDIYNAKRENKNLQYIYPKSGFVIWMDSLAIPKNAPHLKNAYLFINFLMQPDIAKEIAVANGFSSPNAAALKLMPKEMREDPTVNPNPIILKRGRFQNDLGKTNSLYEKYWEMLKLGG